MPRKWISLLALFAFLLSPCPALPCMLCGGNPQTTVTIRQAAAQAKMILYGTMANPRLNPPNVGLPGSGSTEFRIEKVIKSHDILGTRKAIVVPRYIPVDPKSPPRFVLFCDVYQGRIDPYRGQAVTSPAVLAYVQSTIALDGKNAVAQLLFFFKYLDHADADLANDAFIEFAKANDQEIGQVAGRLAPETVRRLLVNPKTPPERLALFAFLLGTCGQARDADLLRALLEKPNERTSKAMDGILCGYIQMRPRPGWDFAVGIVSDPRKPFADRYAVMRAFRFLYALKGQETQPQVQRGMAAALEQADIADLAIDDLRLWKWWGLTGSVLQQFGKKTHDAPLLRRAIVRYALSCPRPEAAQFVARVRKWDADLVNEIQEGLELEK